MNLQKGRARSTGPPQSFNASQNNETNKNLPNTINYLVDT